jgi:PHD/YefM family antitoxin component YafN of YafNO toxin-antitoxin module
MEMKHIIPASEFTRNFGRYQMLAQRAPVAVTSHGRTTGYFIAAEDYEAFKRFRESRRSFATAELSEEKARAISSARMDERHAHLDAMLGE